MPEHQHFTTRRGFIAAMGFGALGLYGTWAVYGASPLPFASLFTDPPSSPPHGAPHVEIHSHGTAMLDPDAFAERQAAFLKQFRHDDGSVHPGPMTLADDDHAEMAAPEPSGHAAMPDQPAMSMPDMATMAPGMDHSAMQGMPGMTMEPTQAMHQPADPDAAIDIYLSVIRFAFDPDSLVLKKGQRYRFLMLASDVTHGAAIALGSGSRVVRLRPGIVTSLELTFLEAGDHLLYCTVHCGAGHDLMHAMITVA